MKFDTWNKDIYNEYVNHLISLQDIKYKEFNSKLIPNVSKDTMIGIRIPILRKIAKKITKSDYKEFLKFCKNKYFEETMIEGLVIASIEDKKTFDKYFKKFITKIDNWATCDTFCNSFKIKEEDRNYYFNYFYKYVNSVNTYEIRCALVIFLNHYIEEKYIDEIFEFISKINNTDYYVQMAIAWLLSFIYIKFKKKTYTYILNSNLDKFTFNKTIQKIIESNRISNEERDNLRKLKYK